jgi:predicted hotdog family 3-hydroxylacyl-ACP dehydratase
MVWVDEVIALTEHGGTCSATLDPEGFYMNAEGALKPTSLIEFVAQSYGYVRGLQEVQQNPQATRSQDVFLVSIGHANFAESQPTGGKILIQVELYKELGPLLLVRGSVTTESGAELGTMELKLYCEIER